MVRGQTRSDIKRLDSVVNEPNETPWVENEPRDALGYFWIDSCCINKEDPAELPEAINSMFHWYSSATKCYVYLTDISHPVSETDEPCQRPPENFKKSRWFSRGWALQELLAPATVELFLREGNKIGDKESLQGEICEATGIPVEALRGSPLSTFPIHELISWQSRRQTTIAEDKAYSLLGISGVYMPLLYGEGEKKCVPTASK